MRTTSHVIEWEENYYYYYVYIHLSFNDKKNLLVFFVFCLLDKNKKYIDNNDKSSANNTKQEIYDATMKSKKFLSLFIIAVYCYTQSKLFAGNKSKIDKTC
jgi:hypothetical protein